VVALQGLVLSLGNGLQHWLATIEQPEFKPNLIGHPKKQTSNGFKTFSQKN
jgi:hypothetical protein